MPARRATARVAAVDRRESILQAARRLFAERGYDGTSIDDIGAAVGLTGPAIYRHFENKPALFVATFTEADRVAEHALDHASRQHPHDAISTVLRAEAEIAVKHREAMLIWQRERNRMPRGKRAELARRRRRLFALLDECLAELRPDLVADAVTELRNVVSSLAMGAADQESGLDDDARIEFLVAAGWTLIDVAARSDAGRRAVGAPVSGA